MKLNALFKILSMLIYFLSWIYFLIIWQGAIPPDLNRIEIRSTVGVYLCQLKSSGNFGTRGTDTVNGIPYYDGFSYFYGIHSPTMCLENLNGKTVKMYFIAPKSTNKKLRLELIDIDSGKIYGNRIEKQLGLYRSQISDRYIFIALKFGIFFLINLIVFNGFILKHSLKNKDFL